MRSASDLLKASALYKWYKSEEEGPCTEEVCHESEELSKRMPDEAIDVASLISDELMETARTSCVIIVVIPNNTDNDLQYRNAGRNQST